MPLYSKLPAFLSNSFSLRRIVDQIAENCFNGFGGSTDNRQFLHVSRHFLPDILQPFRPEVSDTWFTKHHSFPDIRTEKTKGEHINKYICLCLVKTNLLIWNIIKEHEFHINTFLLQL